MSWLENLQEARAAKGVSLKWIVKESGVPERTVIRTFSGKNSPSMATLQPICRVLDVSLDDILSGTRTVISAEDVPTLLKKIDGLNAEIADLTAKLGTITAENALLREQATHYKSDNNILKIKLEMTEKLLEVHEHYMNKQNN